MVYRIPEPKRTLKKQKKEYLYETKQINPGVNYSDDFDKGWTGP